MGEWGAWGSWGEWGEWGEWGFEGPNPFFKAFLGSFLLQLGPIVIEVDKVYGVHGFHGVIEVN